MLRSASTLALVVLVLSSCDSDSVSPQNKEPAIDPVLYNEIDTDPDWGPDGRSISYTHGQDVWVIDLVTRVKRPVTRGFDPDWSPDGQHLAYTCGTDVCRVEVATGAVTQLTTWGNCFSPHWSPDGTKIAFDTNHGDPKGASAVWVMDADGSNKRDISAHGTGEWRAPSWTPDGKILHTRFLTGVFGEEIFLMDADGSNGIRLTHNDRNDRYPSFSPQAEMIAWMGIESRLGPGTGVWTMRQDGSGQVLVVPSGRNPAWSPDGRRIIYHAPYAKDVGSLWIANADGTNPQLLTRAEDYLPAQ